MPICPFLTEFAVGDSADDTVPSTGLVCYCNSECPSGNNTCVTDGVCFTSVEKRKTSSGSTIVTTYK